MYMEHEKFPDPPSSCGLWNHSWFNTLGSSPGQTGGTPCGQGASRALNGSWPDLQEEENVKAGKTGKSAFLAFPSLSFPVTVLSSLHVAKLKCFYVSLGHFAWGVVIIDIPEGLAPLRSPGLTWPDK